MCDYTERSYSWNAMWQNLSLFLPSFCLCFHSFSFCFFCVYPSLLIFYFLLFFHFSLTSLLYRFLPLSLSITFFFIFPFLSCCFLFFPFCLYICTCYFTSFPVSVSDFPLSLYFFFFPSVFVFTFCQLSTIYVLPLLIVYPAVTHNIR